jgi:hypothetical protein
LCISHLLDSFLGGHLGLFCIWAIVNNAAINIEVCFQEQVFNSVGCSNSTTGITGSHGWPIFKFLRNLHTVYHSSCTNFAFLLSVFKGSLHSCQHLLSFVILIAAILTRVRWSLLWFWFAVLWWLVILSIFMCLLNIYMSSFELNV